MLIFLKIATAAILSSIVKYALGKFFLCLHSQVNKTSNLKKKQETSSFFSALPNPSCGELFIQIVL